MPGRVLVAVDEAGACRAALLFACVEACRAQADIELVHVAASSEVPTAVPGVDEARRLVAAATGGTVTLSASAHRAPSVGSSVAEVLAGVGRRADLLVLQHRRLTRLRRLTVGCVSVTTAGLTDTRTVSVPEDWRPRRGTPYQVGVGVDAVPRDGELLATAFARAAHHGGSVRVLHAWQLRPGYDDARVAEHTVDRWRRAYVDVLEDWLARLRAEHPTVGVAVDVVHAGTVDALVRLSRESELLLLGQGGLTQPLVDGLGPVPRALLSDAKCPVEVVPDRGLRRLLASAAS